MKNAADAHVRLPTGESLVDRLLRSQRRKLLDAFHAFSQAKENGHTVLDLRLVDSTPPDWPHAEPGGAVNRVWVQEINLPRPDARKSPSISGFDRTPPAGFHLPYTDGQFDWAFCSEVIERVGCFEKQYALVKELNRVSRKGVFITAGNRNHPIEFHTGLPLLHWLPESAWRRTLKWLGKGGWASGSALTLLDADSLYRLARLLPGKPRHDVGHKRIFGIKAHFFLMIEKL